MVLGVAFVPFVDFWVGVAFVRFVEFRVDITSGPSATPSSLCFKAGRAERCSRGFGE